MNRKKSMKYIIWVVRILFFAIFFYLILNSKNMLWLAIYGASLVIALLFGRKVYCNLICPMNTVMIPTEWLSKKQNIQIEEPPKWLASGKFAWFSLISSAAIMIFAKRVFHNNIPVLLFWLVASVIITFRYKADIFHNLICPFGTLQNFFSKRGIFTKKINDEFEG